MRFRPPRSLTAGGMFEMGIAAMTNHSGYARKWIINDSRDALTPFMKTGDEISILEHRAEDSPIVYYTVKCAGRTSALDKLMLFPRGHETVVWNHAPLQPGPGRPFSKELKDLQRTLRVKALRLEGDLSVGGSMAAVMLWLVEGAIQGKTIEGTIEPPQPILVIDLKAAEDSLWQQPGESGTGTGDPKKQ